MAKTVSLRDANQNFAKYIREAEAGEEILVTRRGEPVAKIVPARPAERVLSPAQVKALRGLEALWRAGHRSDRAWTRDELHER